MHIVSKMLAWLHIATLVFHLSCKPCEKSDTKDAKLTLDQSQNLDAEPKAKLLRLTKGKNFVALKAFFFYDYENQKSVFLVFTEKPPENFFSLFCTDSAFKTIDAQMFFLFGIFENVLTKIIPDLWLLDLFCPVKQNFHTPP